jgi:hypothetical protein
VPCPSDLPFFFSLFFFFREQEDEGKKCGIVDLLCGRVRKRGQHYAIRSTKYSVLHFACGGLLG